MPLNVRYEVSYESDFVKNLKEKHVSESTQFEALSKNVKICPNFPDRIGFDLGAHGALCQHVQLQR